MDMGAQAPVPELRGPKVGKSSAPGAADTQMALLARLSLFDRVDAGAEGQALGAADCASYGTERGSGQRRRTGRWGADVQPGMSFEGGTDASTVEGGAAPVHLSTATVAMPAAMAQQHARFGKEGHGAMPAFAPDPGQHAAFAHAHGVSHGGGGSRTSSSTNDSQGSHGGQIVFAKPMRGRHDAPWDDDDQLHRVQHLMDDPAAGGGGGPGRDGFSALGPLHAARAHAQRAVPGGPPMQGVPLMPPAAAAAGHGQVPTAAWGPVHGGHNGPLIIGAYPEPLRRDQEQSAAGPGRTASDPSDYFFSVDEALSGSPQARTTLMIKNIPNKYTQRMLLDLLDSRGFARHYDFFYLPLDFRNRCNLGYAFVNFISAEVTASFFMVFQGTRWGDFNSRKVCNIAYARLQGKAALVDHFRSSRGFHAGGSEEFLPVVFDLPAGGMYAAPQPLLPPQPPPMPHGMYPGGGGVANLGAALQAQAQLLQQQILNHELQLQERAMRLAAKGMRPPAGAMWQGGAPPPPPGPPGGRGHPGGPPAEGMAYPQAIAVQAGAGGAGLQHFVAHAPGGAPPQGQQQPQQQQQGEGSSERGGSKAAQQLAAAQPLGAPPPGLAAAAALSAAQAGMIVHGGLPVAIPLTGALHPQFAAGAAPQGPAAQAAGRPGADGAPLPMAVAVPMPDPPLPPGAPPPLPPGAPASTSAELQWQQHLQEQLQSLQAQQRHHLQLLQSHQQQQQPPLPPQPPQQQQGGGKDPAAAVLDDGVGSGDDASGRRSAASSASLEEQIQQLPSNPFSGGDAAGPQQRGSPGDGGGGGAW